MVAPMPLESWDRSIPPGAALVNLNQTLVSQLWAEILVKDVIKEFKLCTLSVSLAQKTEGKQGLIGIRYYKYNHLDHCYWEEGAHTHNTLNRIKIWILLHHSRTNSIRQKPPNLWPNVSQIRSFPQVGQKIKKNWNRHLVNSISMSVPTFQKGNAPFKGSFLPARKMLVMPLNPWHFMVTWQNRKKNHLMLTGTQFKSRQHVLRCGVLQPRAISF